MDRHDVDLYPELRRSEGLSGTPAVEMIYGGDRKKVERLYGERTMGRILSAIREAVPGCGRIAAMASSMTAGVP